MTFLTLQNLTKSFGDFRAVRDMTLSIERGEFISLLGPSGCGKTTTLQMVAGLLPPTSGSILLDGKDITKTPPNKRGLGIVFQSLCFVSAYDRLGKCCFWPGNARCR